MSVDELIATAATITAAWSAVACAVSVAIGKSIRLADNKDKAAQPPMPTTVHQVSLFPPR